MTSATSDDPALTRSAALRASAEAYTSAAQCFLTGDKERKIISSQGVGASH